MISAVTRLTSRIPIAGACLFFIAFATARAVRVPLTYDEAATYLRYISTDFLSVFNFSVANNHFANSLLTKLSSLVFGDSELALRLPTLIAYCMYMFFCLLILRELKHRVIACAGFLLLNLNPYVLDYFALSRGYGLSLAFLMGTLFFLFRFLAQLRTSADSRHLFSALMFACGAAMANFTLLNVFLGVFGVGLVALIVANAFTSVPPGTRTLDRPPRKSRRHSVPWLPLVAAIFTALVLSQDIALSEKLFEPVTVDLVGLNDAELDTVRVARFDIRGRALPLLRQAGAPVWRLDRRTHFAGLRIEMPAAAADKVELIEVTIGSRRFWHDRRRDAGWIIRDAGASRIFESGPALSLPRSRMPAYRPIMNWAGDARYVACVATYTAFALAALAALAILLKAAGALAGHLNLLSGDQWRALASGALWCAALAGPPLYLLRRNAELYYGGNGEFIEDTYYSLIHSSFYGRTYHPDQNQIVFVAIIATVAVFSVVFYVSVRRRLASVLPAVSLLAIIVIASVSVVAQRSLFQTPYLLGRSGLFFIPLYVLFVTFLCETIAELGHAGKVFATSILMVVLSFSIYHFMVTANLKETLDWPDDAGTKAMMEDLGQIIAAEHRPRVVLGVDWFYSAVAAYYADTQKAAIIDIVVVPTPSDFMYLREGQAEGITVLKRYPVAGSMLARPGTTR